MYRFNRPFPSCLLPLYQNESWCETIHVIQLFRERLSFKRGQDYATTSKLIMGNGGFYGCLIELQGVSAWWKGTTQTSVFLLSRSLLLNHLDEPQSIKTKLLLPIMPIDIVAYTFTLLWENLCRRTRVSYGYPNTERRVENATRSGVFSTKFEVFG